MPLKVADVKKIVLSMIGGKIQIPVPTVKVAGATPTVQIGGLISAAASLQGLAQGGLSGLSGALGGALGGQLSGLGSGLTGGLGGALGITEKLSQLNVNIQGLSEQFGQLQSITDLKDAFEKTGLDVQLNIGDLSNIANLKQKASSFGINLDDFGDLSNLQNLGGFSDKLNEIGLADAFDLGDFKGITNKVAQASEIAFGAIQTLSANPGGLSQFVKDLATDPAGLEAGLSKLSQNPLNDLLTTANTKLSGYTSSNYAGLAAAIPAIAADATLSEAYTNLKLAIGGSDGLSGAVIYVDKFANHTDRLSGLTLAADSTGTTTQASGSQYLYYYGLPANVATQIITLDSTVFRSAKYFIQGSTPIGEHQTSEFFLVHDGTQVYAREVDLIYTQDPFISLSAKLENNNVYVTANSTIDLTDLVIYGVQLEIATQAQISTAISQNDILQVSKAMQGYFPEDNTNYIQTTAGSLYKANSVQELNTYLSDFPTLLTGAPFLALDTTGKRNYINSVANSINTLSQALKDSIDSDLANYQKYTSQIEAAGIVSDMVLNYSDPNAREFLQLTSKKELLP